MIINKKVRQDNSSGFSEDRKLAFSFGAVILSMMLVITIAGLILFRYQQITEENRLSGAVAGILNESINRISFSGKYHTRLLLEQMKASVPVLESVSVERFDGEIIASSDPALNDTYIHPDEPRVTKDYFQKEGVHVSVHEHNGKLVKEIIAPLSEGLDPSPSGIIRLGINIENSRRWMRINLLIMCSLLLVLTASAIWIVMKLSRYFGGRVRDLAIRMMTILDNSPALIYMKDYEGRYLFINRQWAELFNTTNENVRGKTDIELFPPEIAKVFMDNDRLVMDNDRLLEIEEYAPLADGIHSYHSVKAAIKDSEGKIYGLCGISSDITEKKKVEEALRENEEIFRHFMENSPIYIFFKDENIRSVKLSRNYEQMLGMPLENILGKTMEELFPSDLARGMIDDDKRILNSGQVITVDEELNGRFYTTIKFPILINGRPRYLAGYTIDITERKITEKEINSERERLLVTLRSIGDAVITTDVSGRIMLMNRVAEELTGWNYDEAMGKELTEVFSIIYETNRTPGENPFEKVLQSGSIVELPQQTLLINRKGGERLIADSGAPIRSADGSISGIVLVFRDITEKRRTDIIVQNSQKLESLGVLAGGIAHDFNNLLSGIFGYLELIRIQLKNENYSKIDNTVEKAMQVFDRTRALTQQLLTFARGGEPNKKNIRISEMLVSNTEFVLSGTRSRGVFDIDEALWPCIADENQIAQVLDNIIINAVQAMPDGGEIRITARNYYCSGADKPAILTPGPYVQVTISDQGPGISAEDIGRIYDPFYTTKSTGTGLGLATSYSIMKRHGGAITAESVQGTGSTFTLYIPAVNDNKQPALETRDRAASEFIGSILIMDDEDFMRNTACGILESMGIECKTASNADQAVAMYRDAINAGKPFTAVILDLTIKGGPGGKDTIERLRQIDPDVKAVASSGYSADPVMANPQKFGFMESLIKPYRAADLLDVLNRIAGRKYNG